MDLINISKEKWQSLWCSCGGSNREAFEENLEKLHENIWIQGLIYVGCVIALYITGVVVILIQSGKKFSSTTSGRICVDLYSCQEAIMDRRRERRISKAKRKKAEKDMEMRGLPSTKEDDLEDSLTRRLCKTPVIKVTKDASSDKDSPVMVGKTSSSSLLSLT